MNRRSLVTRHDYEELLIQMIFKVDGDYVAACVARALADIRRTLHGLTKLPRRDEVELQATALLHRMIQELQSGQQVTATSAEFDQWHHVACQRLIAACAAHGYADLTVGHAQRWINLVFRYAYTMGELRVPGLGRIYPLCHVPLDVATTNALADYGAPTLSAVWSYITDYREYLGYQVWVRQRFALVPLDVDAFLLLGRDPEGDITG